MTFSSQPRTVVFVLLLLCAALLFANTFGAAWSHDDFPVIVDNPDVRSLSGFFNDSYPGRPLRELTFLVDYQLFGLNPSGYHLQNVFWHGLNAFFLFVLATELGVARRGAWLAALLFLSHPLQVEVVANISHRKDSLALAFSLVALLAWLRGRRDGRYDRWWLVASILLGNTALLAKENAVVLPVVVLGYELQFRNGWARIQSGSRSFRVGLILIGIGVGGALIARYIWGKNLIGTMASMLATKAGLRDGFSVSVYYATVLKGWLFNWIHFFWPRDLAIEYDLTPATGFSDPWVLAALAVLIGLFALLIVCWRRLPVAAFGLGWFFLFWLPTSNLIPQVYFAADRYMYAPLAGASLSLAVFLDRSHVNFRWFQVVGAGLVLVLSIMCWQQNRVWLTVESLWTQAVKVSPRSAFALNNLGNVNLLKGNLVQAQGLYQRSITVDPLNPTAFYNLGLIYEKTGMLTLALENYRKFLRIKAPEYVQQADALRQRLGE